MKRIIWYVKAGAILHNLLIKHEIPMEWILPEEVDNEDDDVLPAQCFCNETRSQQVHNYLDQVCNC